jgi:hypothetical protein
VRTDADGHGFDASPYSHLDRDARRHADRGADTDANPDARP